jgi:hypothetical protein
MRRFHHDDLPMTESDMHARVLSVLKLFCGFRVLLALGLTLPALPARADNFYAATPARAAQAPGTLLKAQPIALPPLFRAQAWRILYTKRDYAGRPLVASDMVIASTVQAATGRPQNIIVWAHPTCWHCLWPRPRLRPTPLQSILGVKELIGAGKIMVATDYPGLGTQGPIGCLIGKGQAFAVLEPVRATARLPRLKVSRDHAIFGFSQGSHAAFFAVREAPSYMPKFTLKAAAAIAPPTDLLRLFSYNVGTIEGKILHSCTLQSWAIKYGLSLRDILRDRAIATAWAINKTCVDDHGGSIDAFKL